MLKKQPWLVDSFICQAGRAIAMKERRARDEAKAADKPEGWDDGLHYFAVLPDQDDPRLKQPKGGERVAPTQKRNRGRL